MKKKINPALFCARLNSNCCCFMGNVGSEQGFVLHRSASQAALAPQCPGAPRCETRIPQAAQGKDSPPTEESTKMKCNRCPFTSSGQLFLFKPPLWFNTAPTEVNEEFCHRH